MGSCQVDVSSRFLCPPETIEVWSFSYSYLAPSPPQSTLIPSKSFQWEVEKELVSPAGNRVIFQ